MAQERSFGINGRRLGVDEPSEEELREIARHPVTRMLEREFRELWRKNHGDDPISYVKVWPKSPDGDDR